MFNWEEKARLQSSPGHYFSERICKWKLFNEVCLSTIAIQVVVAYKTAKLFNLTPSRKKIGRVLGRGNKSSLAAMVVHPSNKELRGHVVKQVGRMCFQEIKSLCSDNYYGMMRNTSDVSLTNFSWESIWIEVLNKAPTLVSILTSCLPAKTKFNVNKKPIICVAAAMLCKFRNPKMCHVQAAFSLILHAYHAGSQVSRNHNHDTAKK